MNYLISYVFSLCLLFSLNVYPQASKVISGPMLSFIDSHGTQMWFLLDSDAENITVDMRNYDNDKLFKEYSFDVNNKHKLDTHIPFTITLEGLLPNKEYIASVFVDSVFVKELDIFTKRPHLDDVQFLLGSGLSTSNSNIFSNMEKTNSDFMVWLGNHTQFESGSVLSVSMSGMINDYINIRKNPKLNHFMSSLPQIGTWGELDFCSVESSWDIKDTTHLVFELFWPNSLQKTYNYTYYDYGTYQRYRYNDLDLFLLDAMTFKSDSTLYGDKQIERLFQEIQNTGATFTIIASPSPFTFDSSDSFVNYKEQFDYFLYRLNISGIDGLVLISTSDLERENHTRMNRYDLSSKMVFTNNDENCENCLYEFNFSTLEYGNYSLINISGKKRNRTLSFESYNSDGQLIYKKELHQKDLIN